MATGKQGKDRESAERRLADAQAKLHSLQEKRKKVVAETELYLERARKRAAKRVETITKEVERRAGKVARAQARLAASADQTRGTASDKGRAKGKKRPAATATGTTPQDAADRLEDAQEQVLESQSQEVVLIPNSLVADSPAVIAGNSLDRYQVRALGALRDGFSVNGATYTEWLAAARLSKRPFLSARRALVDAGLVGRAGNGQGARYVVTEAGARALP